MAPKQKLPERQQVAKKQQSVSDKTFGLKNKNKSAKVQRFVQQVESQGVSSIQKKKEAEQARRLQEKKAAEQARLETAALFNPIIQAQKVPFGVDPKTVLCTFFKQGTCTKGSKCKFSHSLEVERKVQKRDLYTDERAPKKDDINDWDEEKLQSVVLSKHGKPQSTTNIVCKYFIEAVETKKYGWFWVCPNGGDTCQYRHSLPQGFTLKTNEQKQAERQAQANKPTLTLEDFLETERHKLGSNLTPVTLESFTKWKQNRVKTKEKQEESKKKTEVLHSGRWLFDHGKFERDDDGADNNEADAWDMSDLRRRADSIERDSEEDEQNGVYDDSTQTNRADNRDAGGD
ncbi:hypothetical protein V1512DRAFT_273030 [Lipomyces arxii]|uniref:uncharacterized protein n=1 Tax=Lipomyces arxii TaxID=56418 RepID=UPI0034CF2B28